MQLDPDEMAILQQVIDAVQTALLLADDVARQSGELKVALERAAARLHGLQSNDQRDIE
jgi:hypothetical protein